VRRAALLASACLLGFAAPAAGATGHRALWTWYWRSPQGMADYAKANGFDRVYLESEGGFGPRVRATIKALDANGIAVEALGGENGWGIDPSGMLDFVRSARAYQRSAPAGARLAGIHVDVEPYDSHAWYRHRARTKASFISGMAKARHAAGPLPLALDIPFWFDGVSARHGSPTSLATALIRRTDATTIMAYRDSAAGVEDVARAEVRLAGEEGKRATVGVETNHVHPASVSFYGQTRADLNAALASVEQRFASKPGFGGLAVEDFHGLKRMPG
jgi:hypothetical protein